MGGESSCGPQPETQLFAMSAGRVTMGSGGCSGGPALPGAAMVGWEERDAPQKRERICALKNAGPQPEGPLEILKSMNL